MKQELRDVIDELNEAFDYAHTKQNIIDYKDTDKKTFNFEIKERQRMDFILGVVSSLYLEAFNSKEVKYEMCLKCKSCEEK